PIAMAVIDDALYTAAGGTTVNITGALVTPSQTAVSEYVPAALGTKLKVAVPFPNVMADPTCVSPANTAKTTPLIGLPCAAVAVTVTAVRNPTVGPLGGVNGIS